MTRKILFVDDEPLIVETFRRLLEERYEIETATSPEEGLRILRGSGPFAVVVSDLRMPEMSGTDFLGKVRQGWPDTVGVMLTGYADLDTTIRILSEGKIFRFLTKPCPREQIILTVEAALAHHRLVVAERDLLGVTLPGLLGAIARDLEKAAGSRPGRARRVGQIARRLAAGLSLENGWQYETAAILSALPRREPTEILPSLASMPRMETVAGIVERGDRPVAEEEMEAEGERALVVLGSLLVQEAQRLETRLDPDRSIEDGLRSLGESGESVPDALVRGLPDSDLRRAA